MKLVPKRNKNFHKFFKSVFPDIFMAKRLLKYKFEDTDLFYSRAYKRDFYLNDNYSIERYIEDVINDFIDKTPKYREIADLYSKITGLTGNVILCAHGQDKNDKWCFVNGKSYPVQDFIDKVDGKYANIILSSCNPESREIHSKKSAVFAYNYIHSWIRQEMSDGKMELFIPKIGYIDSYTIDYELEKLKEQAGLKPKNILKKERDSIDELIGYLFDSK